MTAAPNPNSAVRQYLEPPPAQLVATDSLTSHQATHHGEAPPAWTAVAFLIAVVVLLWRFG